MTNTKSPFGKQLQNVAVKGDIDAIISMLRPKLKGKYEGLYYGGGQKVAGMDVDDIIAIMEIKIWRTLEKYDPAKASYATFISRTLDNTYRDILRKAGRAKHLALINADAVAEERREYETAADTGHEVLGENDANLLKVEIEIFANTDLTSKERTVIALKQKGYTSSHIAKIMGISAGRVSQLLSRAREKWLNADQGGHPIE